MVLPPVMLVHLLQGTLFSKHARRDCPGMLGPSLNPTGRKTDPWTEEVYLSVHGIN